MQPTDLEDLRDGVGIVGGSAIGADDGNGRPAHLYGVVAAVVGQLVVVVSRGCRKVEVEVLENYGGACGCQDFALAWACHVWC